MDTEVTTVALGFVYAIIGAAIAMCAGIGSAIGVSKAGQASAGLLSKQPDKFGNVLTLQLLPASQAIYGFVVAFFAFINSGLLGGTMVDNETGLAIMFACVPIGIVGAVSAICQGNVAVGCISLIGKQEGQIGKTITMTVLVEIFAIFAFVVSLLGIIFLAG